MGAPREKTHWYDILALLLLAGGLCAKAPPGSALDGPKIAVIFAVMIALIRRNLPVGAVLLIGAPILGTLFEVPGREIFSIMTLGAFDPGAADLHRTAAKALGLGLVVFAVTTLGNLLVASKAIRGLILALEDLLRDVRWIAACVPATIGLLPMPGGAMLSAPIVGELSERLEIDAETKMLANYWFRHVWEYCWLLYPGLIYVSTVIPGRTLNRMLVAHCPLTIAAITVGVVAILLPIKRPGHAAPKVDRKVSAVLAALWPIAAIVITVATASRLVSENLRVYLLALATAVVVIVFSLLRRISARAVLDSVKRALSLQLALLVVSIYIVQAMFKHSGAAGFLSGQLSALGVPQALILFLVPMTVGLLTGFVTAAIAIAFPLILPLIGTSTANVMLAYAGGFLGVLLSPVHLCLVLTRDYFGASWRHTYRRLIPCVGAVAAFAFLLYLLYKI